MHAHRCTVCHARGIETIWIHGDEHANNRVAHKCPKCGSENWQKFMIEIGQLPQQHQQQQRAAIQVLRLEDALAMAFTYAALVMVIVIVAQNWERILEFLKKVRT